MTKNKKKENWQLAKRILLCLAGSLILAFGTAAFLVPADIVAGGVSGIGIIFNHFLQEKIGFDITDIVVWICNIVSFILAAIFLGKRFTLNTLICSFAYPLFLSLFTRTNILNFITKEFSGEVLAKSETRLVMAGIFGGFGVGAGVSITFLGEGSTGGLDVISFIINKATGIKQSVTSFILDTTVILLGLLITNGQIFPALIGALSSFISAIVIHYIYDLSNPFYIAEIISDKYSVLIKYVIEELDRTATIFPIKGGYSNVERKMIRVIFSKKELVVFKEKVREIDPKAFISIVSASKVLGEGFTLLDRKTIDKILEKFSKKKKNKKNESI